MIYEFDGFIPVIHESAFVHPNATVTGNVTIGRDVYVGPGAAIRGDWGGIEIGDGCNVQENCTIHMFPGVTVVLEPSAHIGHGAIIGSGAVVTSDVPDYGIVGGNPARLIRTRYNDRDIARLLAVAWWDWPAEHITEHVRTLMSGSIDELEAAAPDTPPS